MSALISLGLLGLAVALGLFVNQRVRVLAIPLLMAFGLMAGSLGGFDSDPVFAGAGHVGLVLLLFFTSLFGNPRAIRDGGGAGLPLAAYDLVLNFAVAWWIGGQFGWDTQDRLFLAGILATSSTAVVLKMLGDEGRITRREGNVLVSMLMIEDWVFLGFYAFLGFRFADAQSSSALTWALWVPLFVAFLLLLRAFREWIWAFRQREVLIFVLTAIGLLGAFLGGQAGLPEVGSAFTTGLVLSGSQGARFLRQDAPYVREAASALFF
ncbi:MAG: cation:proton antiporter, partial [Anaerolineales bacterium]